MTTTASSPQQSITVDIAPAAGTEIRIGVARLRRTKKSVQTSYRIAVRLMIRVLALLAPGRAWARYSFDNSEISTQARGYGPIKTPRSWVLPLRAILAASVLTSLAVGGSSLPAAAVNQAFPSGWSNPTGPATYEDWGFGSCNPPYTSGKAHLGADSQGTRAGQAVVAMSAGTVVNVVASNWGPGGAIGIEHTAGDGTRFLAVYGHVNVGVGNGARVTAGQQIGTLYDWAANSHLHLGIRPLASGENAAAIQMRGTSACTSTAPAPTYGFVNPIPFLAARSSTGGSVTGSVDLASGGTAGFVQLGGWVMDPDAPSAASSVHVYLDGPAGSGSFLGGFTADVSRPDVAAAFPGAGDAHGYSFAIGGIQPGVHTVYVYGINIAGGGVNPLLRQVAVTVPGASAGSPIGSFDVAEGRVGGAARVAGWTIDPDAMTAPTEVHAYVDGPAGSGARGINLGLANASRPDVGTAYPGAGNNHGYDAVITGLNPGKHTIWMYAINAVGAGGNPLQRTVTVTIP